MKWLKIAIYIIIIIILILVALLLLLNKENKSNNIIEKEGPSMESTPIENASIEKVNNRNDYYTIKYILNTYFEYVNYIEASATDLELNNSSNEQEIIQKYTQIGLDGLKNIMDENYFKDGKNDEQIKENALKIKNKNFRINRIYYQNKSLRKTIYFVYITLDYKKETKLMIKLDAASNCFSILPEDYINSKQYSEKDLNGIEITDINVNNYNQYEYISVTDKMMAECYLEDYTDIMVNDVEKSYEMLEEEYKQYQFETLQKYKEYIANSPKDYKMLRATAYKVIPKEDCTIYTCKDQYGNVYLFKETAVMEYTVQLDDYTLENEAFNQKYEKANSRDKGILNIDKFFEMINRQDYTSAYALLDANFKQNYFKTQTEFETYIKNKVFRYNTVEYKEYSNQITDIYTYKVMLTDTTKQNSSQIEFSIVIKLLEGTNFVMSFAVN